MCLLCYTMATKQINKTVTVVVLFVVLGVTVPILLASWGNLTAAFSGTVLGALFSATIGQLLIGAAVIFLAYKQLQKG